MADNTIDSLEIQISAAAGKAINELDRLTGSLTGLKNALKFDNANQMKTGFDGVTKSAGKTATTLKSLSKDFLSSFGKISKSGLEEAEQALYVLNEQMKAGIDISSKAKKSLSSLSDEFVSFEQLSFDTDGLSELNDLSKLAKDTLRRLAEEALTTGASFRTMDNEIADIIEQFRDNPQVCRDELISAALSHGGHDNVTVALCSVQLDEPEELATTLRNEVVRRGHGYRNIFLLLLVIMILAGIGLYFFI